DYQKAGVMNSSEENSAPRFSLDEDF
ncbi:MAG: hypothetical protein ACI81T_003450, partial [Bacteroidia bacterium]